MNKYYISQDRLLEVKEEFKEVLFYFNCYSEFDEEKQRFNEIYELDGIKWNIGSLKDTGGYGLEIQYEGEIPFQIFENISIKEDEADFWFVDLKEKEKKTVLTDFSSFIKAIVEIHNFYYGTQITSGEVRNFVEARNLKKHGLSEEMGINDLARVANEYYLKHYDSKVDDYDLAINKALEEIEDKHLNFQPGVNDYEYDKTPSYEMIYNNQARTRYLQTKNCEEEFIMTSYEINQNDIMEETNAFCSLFSIKPLSKEKDFCFELSHTCSVANGNIYSKKMYKENEANNLHIRLGSKYDEFGYVEEDEDFIAWISYNLNNHMISITDYTKEGFPETKKKLSLEEKEALYNLLNAVNEKLKRDFKEEAKVLKKSI